MGATISSFGAAGPSSNYLHAEASDYVYYLGSCLQYVSFEISLVTGPSGTLLSDA